MGKKMRAVARGAALALAVLLLSPAAVGAAGDAVEVYRAANRPAAELLPLAEAALAGEGSAALDSGTNSVVLIGPPAAVERTLALLRQQDQRRRTVVLRYESRRAGELAAQQIRVEWSTSSANLRVGNVIFPRGRTGARVSGGAIRGRGEDSFAGTVRVLDGEVGQIGTGRSVPVHSRGVYTYQTTFVAAERGFTARPRILADDRVQVEITPTDDVVDDRGRVEFTGAATTVIVKPGETVALAGISQGGEGRAEGSRVISASGTARDERILLLSVDVE
jgi:type II secretory pathway component GspD/PulD (secretin)